jgi:hypothetical protein
MNNLNFKNEIVDIIIPLMLKNQNKKIQDRQEKMNYQDNKIINMLKVKE